MDIKLPITITTKEKFNALVPKDPSELYVVKDAIGADNTIFLGINPIATKEGVTLSDDTDSTSDVTSKVAATPKAVKSAYDLANGKAELVHNHGGINSVGVLVGASEGNPVIVGTGGVITFGEFGDAEGTFCEGDDTRLGNDRKPTLHSDSHKHGGSDEIATATPSANAIPKALDTGKLEDGWVGNADTASKLQTARVIKIAGDASGQVEFDGNSDVILDLLMDMPPTPVLFKGIVTSFYGELGGEGGKNPIVGGTVKTDWHVCDGTDGTPDLRNRFVVGASATKPADSKGGSGSHTHSISTSVKNHDPAGISGSISSAGGSLSGSITSGSSGIYDAYTGNSSPSGTVGSTTLGVSQMPAHAHVAHAVTQTHSLQGGSSAISPLMSSSGSIPYFLDATGGSGAHTHSFSGTSHNHTVSFSDRGHSHSHNLSVSSHTHASTLTTPIMAHTATSVSTDSDNTPPYMALHYIMYIGA